MIDWHEDAYASDMLFCYVSLRCFKWCLDRLVGGHDGISKSYVLRNTSSSHAIRPKVKSPITPLYRSES